MDMAQGRKSNLLVVLSEEERSRMEAWQRSTTVSAGLARRGRIILLRAAGASLSQIGRMVGIDRRHVRKWIKRFLAQRLSGLADKPGRGQKPVFSPHSGRSSGQDGVRAA
jgi:hypothetical protein